MNADGKPLAYTRCETDAELRARVAANMSPWAVSYMAGLTGDQLDIYVWDVCKVQRKIIEVYP